MTDPVDEAISAQAPDILDVLNRDFEDSVLFVGRILGRQPEATAARVTAVDRAGVDIVTTGPAGDQVRRLEFPAPVGDPAGLSDELLGLVLRARQASGEDGETSAEREVREAARIPTFLAEVAAVRDLRPHLREVTVRGDDLRGFVSAGPDSFVYLLLPPAGRDQLTVGRDFTWEACRAMADEDRPGGAYYTVRRSRPEAGEIDLHMVLHGDAGSASAWAARARPGDPVALWGPRTAFEPPPGTDRYVLMADETGLPAVAAILESLPAGTPVRVLAEVASASEQPDLPGSPSCEVTWLHRDGAPAGTTTLLPDALRTLAWPGGTPYVWGGAESHTMTAARCYVRREVGLPRGAVSLTGYWRGAEDGDVRSGAVGRAERSARRNGRS